MASRYFRVSTTGGRPQHREKQAAGADVRYGGIAHWTLSPLGDEAILQMEVTDANARIIGNELTLRSAQTLSAVWSALKPLTADLLI